MNTVKLLVLGSVYRSHPAHGYRILHDMKKWQIETWTSVKPGSIYHAITQLEKQSYLEKIAASSAVKLGPAKSEYIITPSGENELFSLIKEALLSFSIEQQSAGVAFMEFLPRTQVIELLARRSAKLREVSLFLKSLPVEAAPSEPSMHPELLQMWITHLNDLANATDELNKRIGSGLYKFIGE